MAAPRLMFAAVGPSENLHVYASPAVDLFTDDIARPVRDFLADKCWRIVDSEAYEDSDMWDGRGEYREIEILACGADQHSCRNDVMRPRTADTGPGPRTL